MEPFIEIYNFIKEELFVRYPSLGACYLYDDEEDPRYKDYYIRHKGDLSFEEITTLHRGIISDVCDFCEENNLQEALNRLSIIMSGKV